MLLKVKLSLKYGICDESCTGFASFGLMLCAIGDGSEAYRFAKLGLQLLDRTTARNQFMPSVYFLAYGWVAPFKIPLRSTFDKLQCAIATARDTCDFEFASSNAYLYLINLFVSGEKLAIIDERSAHFATMMKQFKHGPWLSLTLLLRQLVRCLMSKTGDTSLLNSEGASASNMEETHLNKRDFQIHQGTLASHRLIFASHFGNIEVALANGKVVRAAEHEFKISCQIFQQYLYNGMSSLEAAQSNCRRKHLSIAHTALKRLKQLAKHCPENILHKVYLLQGEMEVLKGKHLNRAMDWYKKAMDHAALHQFGHLHAMAYERAAIAHQRLDSPNSPEASRLMSRAIELYDDWGGAAVVAHLKKTHNL